MSDKLKEGRRGEDVVIEFYKKKGYKFLDRNFYYRGGEIDLIFRKNNMIVFVEVKKRKKGDFLYGVLSVDKRKIKRIIKGAKLYLERKNLFEKCDIRFDVAIVEEENIEIFENAFDETWTVI